MKVAPNSQSFAAAQAAPEENPELSRVSKQFEALLVDQMISAMRKTVTKDSSLIPESQGERVFQSMLDTQNAQTIADTEQIGLSKVIYEHLLRGAASK